MTSTSNTTYLAMQKEHKAWKEMFDIIAKIFQVSNKKLNEIKYRKVFEMIERWAYFDGLRRDALREDESEFADDFGLFWKGED